MATVIFKCRKCRSVLFDHNAVVTSHSTQYNFDDQNSEEVSCDSTESTVWYIGDVCFPDWIRYRVDEANWLKGRLTCPKCNSRLGSFDFTKGNKCQCRGNVLPATHITKARVDCDVTNPLDNIEMSSLPVLEPRRISIRERRVEMIDQIGNENEFREISSTTVSSTVVPHSRAARLIQPRQTKQRNTSSHHHRGDMFAITSMHSSVDNEQIQDNLICPICLEMYYCPTVCHPCRHIFCDPCLRRLAKRKPTKTPCPLCRRIIHQCTPHAEFQQQILLQFPRQHALRKTQEFDLNAQNLPLPWKPRYHIRWFSRQANSSTTWRLIGGNFTSFFGVSTLHIRVSTLTLLFVLLAVCVITCAGGFFFVKYLIWLCQWVSEKCHYIISYIFLALVGLLFRFCIEQFMVIRRQLL